MADIELSLKNKEFDLKIADQDLSQGNDLYTAIYISLFSWARGDNNDDHTLAYYYGWWGDGLYKNQRHKTGSKLWMLYRKKLTPDTATIAVEYIYESLQWLIDDKVVDKIVAEPVLKPDDKMDITIKIYRGNNKLAELNYTKLWQDIGVKV